MGVNIVPTGTQLVTKAFTKATQLFAERICRRPSRKL